jgi:hypothetical protein
MKNDFNEVRLETGELSRTMSGMATREDLISLRAHLEGELRSMTWRFATVVIAAMTAVTTAFSIVVATVH